MRLFTAIDLPGELIGKLTGLIDALRPTARINWSPAANLHITTKFIGEWPEAELDRLTAALAALPPREPIPIELRGVGFFPNSHSPRVFFASVRAADALPHLARETSAALEAIGVKSEARAFSPHLTLARIKTPVPMQPLREAVAALPSTDFGAFTVDRFYLYRSQLKPTGSVYTKLSDFPFRK
ncbi:MAG TPA: RNA 2',3'-cyclic phosphodiesterase [Bryobacteraceae bacterium]|nr:RNA 2',3'-cyclic phosphodiesterase [Bryobacteraceae bacterium]